MDDIRLIIFDLAGTTIVDNGQVPAAFIAALNACGINVSNEDIRKFRGASKREAIHSLISVSYPDRRKDTIHLMETIYKDFNNRLAGTYLKQGVRAVPGAAQTFKWLREHGIKAALNTGFDRSIVEIILNSSGWKNDVFDAVVCGEDVSRGRPAPFMIFRAMELAEIIDIRQVANIGDTALDLQAGWKAGVRWNIAVLSGAHTAEQLSKEQHTHIIQSIAFVPSLFQ